MKFLDEPDMEALTLKLAASDLGDRIIHGRIEAYSCKRTKDDHKLNKALMIKQKLGENSIDNSIEGNPTTSSPGSEHGHYIPKKRISNSPTLTVTPRSMSGTDTSFVSHAIPLSSTTAADGGGLDKATIDLLTTLIGTINNAFSDYDFSDIEPEQFAREDNVQTAMTTTNNLFVNSIDDGEPGFKDQFWKAIDNQVQLDKCEVFTFDPDPESDLSAGKLWAMNYFFYNKKLKRVVFLEAHAVSKFYSERDCVDGDLIDMDTYVNNRRRRERRFRRSRSKYRSSSDDEDCGVTDDNADLDDEEADFDVNANNSFVDIDMLTYNDTVSLSSPYVKALLPHASIPANTLSIASSTLSPALAAFRMTQSSTCDSGLSGGVAFTLEPSAQVQQKYDAMYRSSSQAASSTTNVS